jgi:hypothetical protein
MKTNLYYFIEFNEQLFEFLRELKTKIAKLALKFFASSTYLLTPQVFVLSLDASFGNLTEKSRSPGQLSVEGFAEVGGGTFEIGWCIKIIGLTISYLT